MTLQGDENIWRLTCREINISDIAVVWFTEIEQQVAKIYIVQS